MYKPVIPKYVYSPRRGEDYSTIRLKKILFNHSEMNVRVKNIMKEETKREEKLKWI